MLLATDLDGTLQFEKGKLSPKEIDRLRRAGSCGITSVLITGRNYHSLMQVLDKDAPFDFICVSGGGGIVKWPEGQWLLKEQFYGEVSESVLDYLTKRKETFFSLDLLPDSHRGHGHCGSNPPEDFFRRRKKYIDWETDSPPVKVSQFIVICSTPKERKELADQLTGLNLPLNLVRTTSPFDKTTPWLEIFPQGVHKGHALDFLMKYLNIPRNKTFALGNDWNDLEMLRGAGNAWVVPGSPDELCRLFPVAGCSVTSPLDCILEKINIRSLP